MFLFISYQIAAAFFSLIFAYQNKVPVRKMRDHGASISEEKSFHGANFALQIMFNTVVVLGIRFPNWVVYSLIIGCIQWLVFDIALNKFTNKATFYVGNIAKLDKLQRKHLGRYAGQIKAAVCLVLIGLLNWLYYSL